MNKKSKTDHLLWLKSNIDVYYSAFCEQFENAVESGIVEMFHYMVNDIINNPNVMKAICQQFPGETDKTKVINAVTFLLERFTKRFNSESAEDLLENTVAEAKGSYILARKCWGIDDNSFLTFTVLPNMFPLNLN